MHIVHTEHQRDHKLRAQCQNNHKGIKLQVSAHNVQQWGGMVLRCNVNNEMTLSKQEHNQRLAVSREVLWVDKTIC